MTRASIFLTEKMDARIKSAHDDPEIPQKAARP
jgi:hypothetical protein